MHAIPYIKIGKTYVAIFAYRKDFFIVGISQSCCNTRFATSYYITGTISFLKKFMFSPQGE